MGLIIDLFAGGGGASTGIEAAVGRPIDIAVNHDPEAIRMYKVNHPDTLTLTEDVFSVDLEPYIRGQEVDLLWGSPDCRHYSVARGGKPRDNGIRVLPWAVYGHCKKVSPKCVIMENVAEIQTWGELDENGRPIKEKAGEEYDRFIDAMISLGYKFESKVLCAADFGAPTTRTRWYAVFKKDSAPRWMPETHNKNGDDGKKKWLECGDYIDWSNLGRSIFTRKKPLAEKTMRRIARGMDKFVINNDSPYKVKSKDAYAYLIQYHSETAATDVRGQTLDVPIQTLDTSNRYGLVTAFLTKFYKAGIGQSMTDPIHTITTSPGHFGLVTAWLTKYYGCSYGQTLDTPLDTITTKDRFALTSALIEKDGEMWEVKDIFLRMLQPEELKRLQGFPEEYIIDHDADGRAYSVKEQVAKIGNSVVPLMAQKIVEANMVA